MLEHLNRRMEQSDIENADLEARLEVLTAAGGAAGAHGLILYRSSWFCFLVKVE